jgi:integrase
LVPVCANALRAWRLQCPKGELDLVFPNRFGRVANHAHLEKRLLKPLQKAAGVRGYGFHAYRHAFASLAIEQLKWSPRILMQVMGHSSIQLTFNVYGHLFESPGDDKEGLRRLESAVGVG